MKRALIVIDMLVDFVTGELANLHAQKIVPNIVALTEKVRREGGLVVFANDAHRKGDFELAVWGPHAMEGTPGAELIPELTPKEGDEVVPKRTYSAFFETGLDQLLRQNKVEEVVIVGQHTHICDRHTAADAFFRGYPITVVSDAVAVFDQGTKAKTEKLQKETLEYYEMAYKARVVASKEL